MGGDSQRTIWRKAKQKPYLLKNWEDSQKTNSANRFVCLIKSTGNMKE